MHHVFESCFRSVSGQRFNWVLGKVDGRCCSEAFESQALITGRSQGQVRESDIL